MSSFAIALLLTFAPQTADDYRAESELQIPKEAIVEVASQSTLIEGVDLDRSRMEYIGSLA